MKNAKWIFVLALLSLLLLLFSTGCSADILKSSQRPEQGENPPLQEPTLEDEVEEAAAEDDTADQADGTDGDDPSGQSDDGTEVEEEPQATENPETNCSALSPHPLGESISEQFELTYDEVMTLYCDGYAFSDIMLALETEELVDLTAEDLLLMVEDQSWEEIWEELGVEN